MKNTLNDLHNHLMMAIEDLDDAETKEELDIAIAKARHKANVSTAITNNAKLMLEAAKLQYLDGSDAPAIFIDKPSNND